MNKKITVRNRSWTVIGLTMMIAVSILQTGCGKKISEDEVNSISQMYAEILLERAIGNKNEDDGKVDSLLEENGYETIADFQQEIEHLAEEDPEGLRAVFDSTQKRLEEIRDNTGKDKTVIEDSLSQ